MSAQSVGRTQAYVFLTHLGQHRWRLHHIRGFQVNKLGNRHLQRRIVAGVVLGELLVIRWLYCSCDRRSIHRICTSRLLPLPHHFQHLPLWDLLQRTLQCSGIVHINSTNVDVLATSLTIVFKFTKSPKRLPFAGLRRPWLACLLCCWWLRWTFSVDRAVARLDLVRGSSEPRACPCPCRSRYRRR